jgi:hypothetical protein
MASQNHKMIDCRKYKTYLANGKVADKIEQKSKNGVAITTECEGEDYLVTEDEE